MKFSLWCALTVCSAWTGFCTQLPAASASGTETPQFCDDLCRVLLGLSPEPQSEIGPPRTFRAKLSHSMAGKIDYYFFLDDDCSQPGLVQLEVVEAPRAGLLAANTGPERAYYPPNNPRSVCNNRRVLSSRLFYMRSARLAESDDFAVVAIYPDSTWEEVHYHVPRR